jgi:hypothetical protein
MSYTEYRMVMSVSKPQGLRQCYPQVNASRVGAVGLVSLSLASKKLKSMH